MGPSGRLVQRSLYIGCDPTVVNNAKELITGWQTRHREMIRVVNLTAVVHGASVRRRRALKKRVKEMAGNPLGLWQLTLDPAIRAHYFTRGHGGPARRIGLW